MASVIAFHLLIIFSLCLLTAQAAIPVCLPLPNIRAIRKCNIKNIYQFGASKADTGNRKIEYPSDSCGKPPYGQSFLQDPTGRCSDGRLMIDYIASAAGLPFLNPYLMTEANYMHGVNFAVGSSTALSESQLANKNISIPGSNSSLGVQLEWMSAHFNSKRDRRAWPLKNAIFFVGEAGSNDYTYALFQGKTTEEAQLMVPEIVQSIMDAVRRVIAIGAVRVIVPGTYPMGCMPAFLTVFESNNSTEYDEHQCLKGVNDLIVAHNDYLQQAIRTLQEENPKITIVYGDYYNAYKYLLNSGPCIGLDPTSALKACCGIGGNYNFSVLEGCGMPHVPVCSDPNQYIHWDGVHLTQRAQSVIATWLVADLIPKLDCNLQVSYYRTKDMEDSIIV